MSRCFSFEAFEHYDRIPVSARNWDSRRSRREHPLAFFRDQQPGTSRLAARLPTLTHPSALRVTALHCSLKSPTPPRSKARRQLPNDAFASHRLTGTSEFAKQKTENRPGAKQTKEISTPAAGNTRGANAAQFQRPSRLRERLGRVVDRRGCVAGWCPDVRSRECLPGHVGGRDGSGRELPEYDGQSVDQPGDGHGDGHRRPAFGASVPAMVRVRQGRFWRGSGFGMGRECLGRLGDGGPAGTNGIVERLVVGEGGPDGVCGAACWDWVLPSGRWFLRGSRLVHR